MKRTCTHACTDTHIETETEELVSDTVVCFEKVGLEGLSERRIRVRGADVKREAVPCIVKTCDGCSTYCSDL